MRWTRVLVVLVFSSALCVACGGGGGGGSSDSTIGGVKTAVLTQADADRVATLISLQWDEGVDIFDSGDWLYTNYVAPGFQAGTVTINGRYRYESLITNKKVYEFDNMSFAYNDYLEDRDFSSLTGSAMADGAIYYHNSGSYYTGAWQVAGTVQLAPSPNPTISGYQFQCEVSFAFLYGTPYGDYVGKIFYGGSEWDVSN